MNANRLTQYRGYYIDMIYDEENHEYYAEICNRAGVTLDITLPQCTPALALLFAKLTCDALAYYTRPSLAKETKK